MATSVSTCARAHKSSRNPIFRSSKCQTAHAVRPCSAVLSTRTGTQNYVNEGIGTVLENDSKRTSHRSKTTRPKSE